MQQRKPSRSGIEVSAICLDTMRQLQRNLENINLILNNDVMAGIEAIHQRASNPCP